MLEVGVISDTHGLLRPEALAALDGVDRILHAGDVGGAEILERLAAIAPLNAVRGNCDHGDWAERLPATEALELEGCALYMLHDIEELDIVAEAAGFAAVVYGHSHVPKTETRAGVLYLNPGSAGPRRFRLPVTLARLTVDGDRLDSRLIELQV